MPIAPLPRVKLPPPAMRLFICCRWQPILLEDVILVAEQSVTLLPKLSHNFQHFTLIFTRQDRWLERPNPINWLVMSSHHTLKTILKNLLNKPSLFPIFSLELICYKRSDEKWTSYIYIYIMQLEENTNLLKLSL